jgi:colicin import membrane protein
LAATLPPALRPLTVPRDALRPPSADNPRLGVAMSLLAHGALLAALTLGVRWHTEEPAAVEAELWAATPQIAAPRRGGRGRAAAGTPGTNAPQPGTGSAAG